MPRKHTNYQLIKLLESANKRFAALIKKKSDVSKKYNKIAGIYQKIIDLIEANKTNTLRELYKLEAHLGLIQCQLNAIPLSPSNEIELQANDQQLDVLATKLNRLTELTLKFKDTLPKNKPDLAKDYDTFLTQVKTYKTDWNIYCYNVSVRATTP